MDIIWTIYGPKQLEEINKSLERLNTLEEENLELRAHVEGKINMTLVNDYKELKREIEKLHQRIDDAKHSLRKNLPVEAYAILEKSK